jgi:hypothetical protein
MNNIKEQYNQIKLDYNNLVREKTNKEANNVIQAKINGLINIINQTGKSSNPMPAEIKAIQEDLKKMSKEIDSINAIGTGVLCIQPQTSSPIDNEELFYDAFDNEELFYDAKQTQWDTLSKDQQKIISDFFYKYGSTRWVLDLPENIFFENIVEIVSPILDKCPLEKILDGFYVTTLRPNCGIKDLQSKPIPFIELMKKLLPNGPYNSDIITAFIEKANNKNSYDFGAVLMQASSEIINGTSNFEQARVIYNLLNNDTANGDDNNGKAREIDKQSKAMTLAFDKTIGQKFRDQLAPGSLLAYTYIFNDGVGDLGHLIRLKKLIAPSFNQSINFIAVYQKPHSQYDNLNNMINNGSTTIPLLGIERDVYRVIYDKGVKPAFEKAQSYICISADSTQDIVPLYANKPKTTFREILPPSTNPNELSMGVKPGNIGVWLSLIPQNPEQTLVNAPESLKNKLGCASMSKKDVQKWYQESVICSTMVYRSEEHDRAIFAMLGIVQETMKDKKRVVFKTNSTPRFLCIPATYREWEKTGRYFFLELSPKNEQLVQKFGVQSIIFNDESLYKGPNEGIELRIISHRLNEDEWDIYKNLQNGLTGVGGDNTFSEALSNPYSLPPLLFSQHKFKQSSYAGIIDVAENLPDHLPGKRGMINYLKTAVELAYWADPGDFARELSKIVKLTGDQPIRNAWGELVKLLYSEYNLHDLIVPLSTEQLFLNTHIGMAEKRKNILAKDTSIGEKIAEYIALVNKMIDT